MKPREQRQQLVKVLEKATTQKRRLREVGEVLRRKKPSSLPQLSSLKVRVVRRRKRTEARKRRKKRRLSLNLPPQSPRAKRRRPRRKPLRKMIGWMKRRKSSELVVEI